MKTLVAIILGLIASVGQGQQNLRIAVASNFYKPLQVLASKYQKETGVRVLISSGSSGKLFHQINHGAPYDIYLSANEEFPNRLYESQLSEKPFVYARGVLVFWSKELANGEKLQEALKSGRLAIANPKVAPYGKAAQEVLKKLDVYPTPKVLRGESVGQALHYAMADAGLTAAVSLAQVKSLAAEGGYFLVPPNLYSPIKQGGVVLASSTDKKEARRFLDYLMGKKSQQLIRDMGYR